MPLKSPRIPFHFIWATQRIAWNGKALSRPATINIFFCALCVIRGQQIVLKGGISETLPAHYHEETLCILWQQSVVDNG
jgi:hypothetical protein